MMEHFFFCEILTHFVHIFTVLWFQISSSHLLCREASIFSLYSYQLPIMESFKLQASLYSVLFLIMFLKSNHLNLDEESIFCLRMDHSHYLIHFESNSSFQFVKKSLLLCLQIDIYKSSSWNQCILKEFHHNHLKIWFCCQDYDWKWSKQWFLRFWEEGFYAFGSLIIHHSHFLVRTF